MVVGKKIKEARAQINMLQSELASRFNEDYNQYAIEKKLPQKSIDKRTISNWENGISSPNVEYLPILCKILNTDINYLLDFTVSNEIKNKLIYKKKVDLDDGNFIEISTPQPWDQLTEEQQKEIMDSVIEESVKLKKEVNKKES